MNFQQPMSSMYFEAKQPSRRKRIALMTAIILLYALMAYLFVFRSVEKSSAEDRSTAIVKRDETINAQQNLNVDQAPKARLAGLQTRSAESPAWKLIQENLTSLSKGDRVEVCGLSHLDAALFVAGDAEVGLGAMNTSLAQLAGRLIISKDPSERVIGLYLQAHLATWAASVVDGSKYRICQGDFDCLGKLLKSNTANDAPPQAIAAAAPLINLALERRDPDTIAAAIYACAGRRDGVCGTISVADWAAVEPNNAVVWLKMADAALYANDLVGRNAALRRAAVATTYDLRAPSLASVLDSDLVKAQSSLVQFHISNELVTSNFNTLTPPITAAARYCLHDKTPDAERSTICDALASKLSQHDEGLIGLATASAIGKKLGWDAARLQAIQDERAVFDGWARDTYLGVRTYSCEYLAHNNRLAKQMLSKSERQIGREVVGKSGKSLAEVAKAYRTAYYPGLNK
ncbi:MAG: hypothetical protein ABI583_11005 [Betaproteobacteria bacterium]